MSMNAQQIQSARNKHFIGKDFAELLDEKIDDEKAALITKPESKARIELEIPEGISGPHFYNHPDIKEIIENLKSDGFINVTTGGSGGIGKFILNFELPPEEEASQS